MIQDKPVRRGRPRGEREIVLGEALGDALFIVMQPSPE
jgi:hypothetical protein